ncbi:MAG: hypothetical protein U0Q18_25325 [Bryobacteraceae bacterium]
MAKGPNLANPALQNIISQQGGLTPQQRMIIDAFDTETYVADRVDVQHEPLYDSCAWAVSTTAATNNAVGNSAAYPVSLWTGPNVGAANNNLVNQLSSQFFVNVGAASNKVLATSNTSTPKKLDAPEAFSIFGFRMYWNSNIAYGDLQSLLYGFALQFVIGNKPYNTGPLWYYQAGGGIAGIATTTGFQALTNGLPGREAMHKLAIPIVIENQMSFYAQLVGTPFNTLTAAQGGQGIILTLLLDGLHARGVQ